MVIGTHLKKKYISKYNFHLNLKLELSHIRNVINIQLLVGYIIALPAYTGAYDK